MKLEKTVSSANQWKREDESPSQMIAHVFLL